MAVKFWFLVYTLFIYLMYQKRTAIFIWPPCRKNNKKVKCSLLSFFLYIKKKNCRVEEGYLTRIFFSFKKNILTYNPPALPYILREAAKRYFFNGRAIKALPMHPPIPRA